MNFNFSSGDWDDIFSITELPDPPIDQDQVERIKRNRYDDGVQPMTPAQWAARLEKNLGTTRPWNSAAERRDGAYLPCPVWDQNGRRFDSLQQAAKSVGVNVKCVLEATRFEGRRAGGLMWFVRPPTPETVKGAIRHRRVNAGRPIWNDKGERFDSVSSAAEKLGVWPTSLFQVLDKPKRWCQGRRWYRYDPALYKDAPPVITKRGGGAKPSAVIATAPDGSERRFASIPEAAKELKCSTAAIYGAIRQGLTRRGYKWRYESKEVWRKEAA